MFIINSLRPVKLPGFELRIGDNKFDSAKSVPDAVRERLMHFSEIPPLSERGILVFSQRDEATDTTENVKQPWSSDQADGE